MLLEQPITPSAPADYERLGYIGPSRAIASQVAQQMATKVQLSNSPSRASAGLWRRIANRVGLQTSDKADIYNRHLNWPAMADLATNAAILDTVASALGPDLMLWRSMIFVQQGTRADSLGWHRDFYPAVVKDPRKQVSVQVALTPTTKNNSMELVAGTQGLDNNELHSEHGLLCSSPEGHSGNTSFEVSGESLSLAKVILEPGEFLLFHPELVHRSSLSKANTTSLRVCVTFRYTTSDNIKSVNSPCCLVRGGSDDQLNKNNGDRDWR